MKIFGFITLLLFVLYSCKNETKAEQTIEIGDFSFSSKNITSNQPFTITYNGSGNLEESFYSNLHKNRSYPFDVNFEKNNATITVPDSITGVAFNFKVDSKYDNNKEKGYLFSVVNEKGEAHTSAEASKQFYAMTYGENYGLKVDPKAVLMTLEKFLETSPELNEDWITNHIYVAEEVDVEKGQILSEAYIAEIINKKDKSYKDYENLSSLYNTVKNKPKADSIGDIITAKYPYSNIAVNKLYGHIYEAKSLTDKEKIFNDNKASILNSKDASFFIQTLAMESYNASNMESFEMYAEMFKDNTSKASLYNSIAWPKAEKGEDLDMAATISKQSLELTKAEQNALKEKPEFYSLNQYKNSLESTYNMYADTYALISFKKGDIKEAVKYQAIAVKKGANPEMNERYIEFLIADNQNQTAMENASKFIKNGNSTSKIKAYFKEAAKKVDPKIDVDSRIAEFEEKAKAKEFENLRKSLLDEEAPNFTLKNLEGKEVTLASLKGKTVVLDFWATWCGPCIASFPGMQEVVTKYKDDENVEFFFIDTFEDGEERLDKVLKFIKDNNYDFNVLIDPVKENSSKHLVADKYGITGIPTKIIIGPSGRINFKSIGFSGSAEKIVSEIDTMVELLK
ncbi:TlpA family protein disulfide reductase [Winogradskyella sp. UBA3174]|uniref:TlpA family protein disulfide reductase n=1 Tax=Winogradskyella sp. UBA3174 TaxID=1947785 RepID=UPI0025DACBC3|nr:TlpA disulfide reductase family protein [Winogradskyella sp. UBA3174]|tara:strand:+ start:56466 stop:58343 length:1878 start_codon:yes stop_codon:yes gene_type:complete